MTASLPRAAAFVAEEVGRHDLELRICITSDGPGRQFLPARAGSPYWAPRCWQGYPGQDLDGGVWHTANLNRRPLSRASPPAHGTGTDCRETDGAWPVGAGQIGRASCRERV